VNRNLSETLHFFNKIPNNVLILSLPFCYYNNQLTLSYTDRIEAHNNEEPKPTFTLGHNAFSDMTNDEFQQMFKLGQYSANSELAKQHAQDLLTLSSGRSQTARHLEEKSPLELPENVNWIALGGVTDVKNQGACGR
jgi:C1A family cysteine protease